MAEGSDQVRHHLWIHFSDAGDVAGTKPRIFLDVARWPGAENLLRYPSEVPHTVAFQPLVHAFCFAVFGFSTAIRGGRNDEYRHAVRVCHRVRGCLGDAARSSRHAATLPHAAGSAGADSWHRLELRHDVFAGVEQLAASDCLAGDWPGDLLHI